MTVSALFQASLITLTRDDSTAPQPRQSAGTSLLDRVANGDARAVRECIDRFGGLVWSIARCLASTRTDIEEAVREIFVDVWRNADRYDPQQGSEEVFVAMIARRRIIDRMRRVAHSSTAQATDDDVSLSWEGSSNSADGCDDARAARQCIMRLRPELRAVLELGILHGLNSFEISHRLKMPLVTVNTLMTRGLIQVRELMSARPR